MASFPRRSNEAGIAGCWARGSPLSPTISPERPQPPDPVLRADFFSFLAAPRKVVNRHLDDAASAGDHLGRDLMVELEPGCFQVELAEKRTWKQLEGRDCVCQISSGGHERCDAQASSTEIRRPRL